MQKENHFEELHDRVQKTATSRFFAHERLKAKVNASLWTITFFSMGLIFIPLIETFKLNPNVVPAHSSFIQIVLAIVILVISVILSMTNYSVRADRMHQCGMLLNALARKIHRYINEKATSEVYEIAAKEYDEILQRHENHASIDYLYTKNHMKNYYKNSWYFPFYIRVIYFVQFTPYIGLLALEVACVYFLIR